MENTTYTVTCDCPFRNICSDNGVKCETCTNNPKRSYYRPVEPYTPYYPEPYYPYYPYWSPWIVTCDTSTNESQYQPT